MGKLTVNEPVKKLFNYCGFTAQKGSITGKICLNDGWHYYVYTGKKRRETRADGTKAGWEISLWLSDRNTESMSGIWEEGADRPYWEKRWIKCDNTPDGKRAARLMALNPHIEWTPKYKEEGERNILAYVPKQKNLGFIYAMVRNRQ